MQLLKSTLVCAIVLLGLVLQARASDKFTSGSDFAKDGKKRYDTCQPLVSHEGCDCSNSWESHSSEENGGEIEISGSGSGSGSGNETEGSGSGSGSDGSGSGSGGSDVSSGEWDEGDYCFLLQIFLKFSIELDVEFQSIFVEWINKTQIEIIRNGNLTEYEKLVELWYSLEILFEAHVEIKLAIKYKYIGAWGYVCDLEGLAIDIQTVNVEVTIEEVILIGGSNGTCPLTEALGKCKAKLSSAADQDKIEELITEITDAIESGESFSETLVSLHEKFEGFFKNYGQFRSFINHCRIKGFGVVKSYLDISATYWRIKYFKKAVGGNADGCLLIKALFDLYSDEKYSISERSDYKQLHDKVKAYFVTVVDVRLRIKYFYEQLYQFFILTTWNVENIYSIEIEGYGSVWELIYAFSYCTSNGIGDGDFTTVEPSTSTTTSTTTTTTTTPGGDCGTVYSVNVFSSNTTILITSITEAQVTWTSTEVTQFAGYKKRIYNLSANSTLTDSSKFYSIKQVFTGFAGSTTLKQKVMDVMIKKWGLISKYCACNP